MKELFLNKSINFITSQKPYKQEDIDKLRYGLEGIYLTFYKMIIILLVAFFLHTLKETIIFLILFNIIRYPAFGFHANTSFECLIISLILMVLLPFLLLTFNIPIIIKIVICFVCLVFFFIYAPMDTIKRPLPNKKKRRIRKFCSCLCCILYTCLMIVFKNSFINNLFFCAIVVETILILPTTYMLFKQPYNNYLNYK